MATQTYEPIASITLNATTASVTFTNIPQTYTDLILTCSLRSSAGSGDILKVRMNGSSSTVYSMTNIGGAGTSAYASRTTTGGVHGSYLLIQDINADNHTASTFAPVELYIPNYTDTSDKPVSFSTVYENNSASLNWIQEGAGKVALGAAITSITVLDYNSVYFKADSSFYLYGIKKN
jgi:hypothetical protein